MDLRNLYIKTICDLDLMSVIILERQKYKEHSFLSQSRKWYTDDGETEDNAE